MRFGRIFLFGTAAFVLVTVTPALEADAAKPRPIDRVRQAPSPPQTTDKIVGGEPAEAGRFPFQVALIDANVAEGNEQRGQFCGGSLIGSRWVLTAAHCVPNTAPTEVDVYIGSTVLPTGGGNGSGALGVRRSVERIVSHQNYDDSTSDNDIALLKLIDAAPDQLRPAMPATLEQDGALGAPGKEVTVIGWGATNEGGATTATLMEVEVTAQDVELCEDNYQAVVPTAQITENMWCAGETEGDKDSCQGDSGGFIGAPAGDGRWVQLGVVSWGIGCARPQLFGVYTRVANYGDWIEEIQQRF